MAKAGTWVKMLLGGGAMCIGGPALIYYVSPSEEEIFLRYNPELQKRSLANRKERQEDFDQFVTRLKQYSKSDKPIWTVWEQDQQRLKQEATDKADAERAARQSTSDALKATSDAVKAEIRAASK